MALVRGALASLVEIHRAHSCAEGKGHCSGLVAGGVQVLVEYREEAVWELVVDRAHSTGTRVERKGFVGWFGNSFFTPLVGADMMLQIGECIGSSCVYVYMCGKEILFSKPCYSS